MDSISNIGRGKLGWMISNRLLEVRTLLGMKSRYSGSADTSARCNGANEMTRIKRGHLGIVFSRPPSDRDRKCSATYCSGD